MQFAHDCLDCVYQHLEVKSSPAHGLGCFAKRHLPLLTCIPILGAPVLNTEGDDHAFVLAHGRDKYAVSMKPSRR